MTLDISAVTPRVQYTVGSTPDSTFDYSFAIFEDADISVYVGSTLKTLTTHYTVSGAGTTSGGTVTMTSGNAVSNATVTLVRNITIARTTDFPASGAFQVDSLNTELDRITAVQQELEDDIGRSLRLADEDATATLTIPLKDARKGRYLAFNSTTGNAEAGPTQTDVTAIADVTSDIALLADIQDGTTATNAITTVASNNSNVTTVAGISANVTTVAGISSDVTAVAGDATDIGAVAGKATEIGRLGTADAVADLALLGTSDVVADMALLATTDVIADMALLADTDVISDMNTLATSDIISDLNTLATSDIVTDMNLLATSANVTAMGHLGTSANVTAMGHLGTSANVTAMGLLGTSAVVEDMGFLGTSANVTAMGLLGTSAVVEDMGFLGTSANVTAMGNLGTSTNVTNMANLNASGVISNISTVAGAVSNVNTVATNISGVNSFADRYRVASSAPTSSLDVGDLYFDTTANELKVYKSSGWSAAGSTVNGTSARFHYNISGTPTTVTGADANGNTLAYDAGFADVYVNGVRMSPDDITITSGTSVVFASALADGDDVDIVAFGTFNVANIVSTGALNTGSITSGFGNIDTGSSTITTTGAISGGTLTGTLQTASQTNITSVGTLSALTVGNNATLSASNPQLFLSATVDGGEGSVNFKDDEGNIDGKIAYRTDYAGNTDNFMTFNTNGSNERMRITDSGLVGIGTIPADALHVKGGQIQIESLAGDGAYLRVNNTANSGGKIWRAGDGISSHGTFSIYDQTDNTFPFNVSMDGVVGSTVTLGVARYRNHSSFSLAYGSNIHLTVGQGLVNVSNRSYGYGALFMVSYASQVAEVSDPSNQFDIGSGGNILGAGVYKNTNNYTLHVINKDTNLSTRGFSVQVISNEF